jgi:hypothetical protein
MKDTKELPVFHFWRDLFLILVSIRFPFCKLFIATFILENIKVFSIATIVFFNNSLLITTIISSFSMCNIRSYLGTFGV